MRRVLSGTGIRGRLHDPLKGKLKRVVAMLPRLAMRSDRVSETAVSDDTAIDYEHEHRCAEHESWPRQLAILGQNEAMHRSGGGQRSSHGKSTPATR